MTGPVSKPDMESVLASWEANLRSLESAAAAGDWKTFQRMFPGVSSAFDRLRALVEEERRTGGAGLSEARLARLAEGVRAVERLTALLAVDQSETMAKIHGRRRARRTTQAYSGEAPTGPQHVRVLAAKPPPEPEPKRRCRPAGR